ncbi:unnamed protein product [Zymoseptoria tritici ST99CH_1A5]|uniref:Class II aldolase/adducin N-terminal domain-containing protein n=1 Tax=Zymoseptoria tritici ST99CH_1A5 TaxID=1276529 RepID=A0A1Y6LZ36_ZYMTR|nr:unnamed protein product [Zymoseptoria tritici ST99CH_1A5]
MTNPSQAYTSKGCVPSIPTYLPGYTTNPTSPIPTPPTIRQKPTLLPSPYPFPAPPMSTPSPTHTALLTASTPPPPTLFSTLLTASHILHHNAIVDAYGHISVRNPQNPSNTFFLSRSLAPALVSSREDILEYRVEDGSPIQDARAQAGTHAVKHFAERWIHSEIYKLYPEVKSVVHCHSEAVIPYGIGSVPLRPVFHMAATMGPQVPVFDIAQHYPSSPSPLHSLLVTNTHLGAALAAGFNPTPSVLSKSVTALKNYLTSSTPSALPFPPCPTVLMRGHGMTCVGRSIEEVVYRAIFTCVNARVQTTALLMQGGYNLGYVAQRFGERGGGKEGGNPGPARQEGVKFLSERECRDSWTEMEDKTGRAWELWCKEVEEVGLYRNEVRDGLRVEG